MQKVYMLLTDYAKIKKYAKADHKFNEDISLNLSLNDFTFTQRHSKWSKQSYVYISVDQKWVKEMRKRVKYYNLFEIIRFKELQVKTVRNIKHTIFDVLD